MWTAKAQAATARMQPLSAGNQVAQIRLHRGEIRLFLRVRELRNRDRGQNTDDHDDDQKLDQCETLAVHLDYLQRVAENVASRNDSDDAYYSPLLRHELCLN